MRGSIVRRMSTPRDGSAPRPRYYARIGSRWLTDPVTGEAFTRKADAEAFLAQTVQAMRAGSWVAPSTVTVAEHAQRWLLLAQSRLKPSTWASYRSVVRAHLLPALGPVRLQLLTPVMLEDLYAGMLSRGLASRTVRYTSVIVKAILEDAVSKGLLAHNPAAAASTPAAAAQAGSHTTWTAGQLAGFLQATTGDELGVLWAFLALTGCRRGEALGLRWADVDVAARRVLIAHTIGAVSGRVSAGTTKSGRGRSIAADPGLIARLDEHRRTQTRQRMTARAWTDTGLVFTRRDGRPLHPDTVTRAFTRAAAREGLPVIRLHDLRHTWATLALQAGVNPKVVQERLGHASVTITLGVYSHVMPATHDAAAQLIADTITAHQPRPVSALST